MSDWNGRGLPAYRIVEIARRFRKKYAFEEPFTTDFRLARELAQRMGSARARAPGQPARASEINALALIEEILRYVVHLYLRQASPGLFHDLLAAPRVRVARLGTLLPAYVREFPAPAIYRRQLDPASWLEAESAGFPNRHLAAQGLFLLLIAERNPAYAPYRELLDSGPLARRKTYAPLYDALHRFFEAQPRFGPDDQNLVDMLRSPAVASPDSLFGQLEYIRYRWGALLGEYLDRLLRALDFLREEQKLRLPLAGLAQPPVYSEGDFEGERYSQDRDWMPQPGAHGQEHPGLAGPALPPLRPAGAHPGPGARRGAGQPGPLGLHGTVADRPVGALPRLQGHQAPVREPGGGVLGLLPGALSGGRGPGRGGRPGRAGRALPCPRHPPGQRHGAQPHGAGLRLGARAPGLVHPGGLPAVSRATPSAARTSAASRGSASSWRTTTTTAPTPPWCSAARTPAARATCITATTARTCRGTTPPSWTT